MAEAYLLQCEPEQAAAKIDDAVDATETLKPPHVFDRLRSVLPRAERYRDVPVLRQAADKIKALPRTVAV